MSHEISGFPLSPQQSRLWRQQQAAGGAFRARLLVGIEGCLEPRRLAAGLASLVARHEILRTRFEAAPGMAEPLQVIDEPGGEVPLRHWPLEPGGDPEALLERLWEAPPEGGSADGLAAHLVDLDDRRQALLLSLPAPCTDGESLLRLTEELADGLAGGDGAGGPGEEDDLLQYADLAAWQNDLLESEDTEEGRDYWHRLDLPPAPPAPAAGVFHPREWTLPVDPALAAVVGSLAGELEIGGDDLLLAGWLALLARLHDTGRPVVARRFDGRRYDELQGAVGPLARYLPLSVAAPPERPFRDLAAEVAERRRESAARQEFLRWRDLPAAAAGEEPWFPFAFDPGRPSPPPRAAGEATLRVRRVEAPVDRFAVELRPRMEGPEPTLAVGWEPALGDGEEARHLARRFLVLMAGAVAQPSRPLGTLPLLTADDRRRLLLESNRSDAPVPPEPAVHRLFTEQAARTPGAEAARDPAGGWTYAELAAKAGAVAAALHRRGVGPEVRVAVLLPRDRRLVATLLGILQAGGAYVPVDPAAPAARRHQLLRDSGAALLVTGPEGVGAGPTGAGVPAVPVDELLAGEGAPPAPAVAGDHLAYVLYTSGSTGVPKGVMVSHRSAVNYLLWAAEQYARPGLPVPVHSSVAFDLTVTALFAPLVVGGWVDLLPEEGAVEALAGLLGRPGDLAFVKLTPSHLDAVSRLLPDGPRARVGALVVGGEQLLGETLAPWRTPGTEPRVVNEYGPTEATVGCSVHVAPPSELVPGPVPIGGPLRNARLYVVEADPPDGGLHPLLEGMAGELLIGGVGLARGYLGRPALTAERFVPDPFSGLPGERLYRSGDRVRRRTDRDGGGLEFLDRVDRQLKVRGHRVEPGEVEAVLRQRPGVGEAVVDLRPDPRGEARLVAWVVTEPPGGALDEASLRQELGRELPPYMEPAAFVPLAQLPLTTNGKLDRDALPSPDWGRDAPSREYVAPRGEVEERLAALWAEVLDLERVGREDNFFELGGDSILGIQLVGSAARHGLRFTARQVFRHQTLAALAAVLDVTPEKAAAAGAGIGDLPLTPVQRWFLDRSPEDPHHFNQALLAAVEPVVRTGTLAAALAATVAVHPSLTERYRRTAEGWCRCRPEAAVPPPALAVVDLSALDEPSRRRARRPIPDRLQRSLDVEAGPLLRAVLLDEAGGAFPGRPRHLLLVVHHLAVDGVSWRILGADLEAALAALAAGERPALPAEATPAAQWAAVLTGWAASGEAERQARFWTGRPWDGLPSPGLERAGSADTGSGEVTVEQVLSNDATAALLGTSAASGARPEELLLAALGRAVTARSGADRLAAMMEGHGRHEVVPEVDLSRTVGWLTALYPVLLDFTGCPAEDAAAAGELLARVRQELGSVPAGGLAFGVRRHLLADGGASADLEAAEAAPRLLFNYHGRADRAVRRKALLRPLEAVEGGGGGDGLGARQSAAETGAGRPFPLEVVAAVVAGGRLRVAWTWAAPPARRPDLEAMASRFLAVLDSLVEHCREVGRVAPVPADFPLAGLERAELERLLADRRGVRDVLPLSPAQQGILYHAAADPGARLYFDQVTSRMEGPLDAAALHHAWAQVQQRHPVLRTSYHRTGSGEPRALVWERAPLPWHRVDLDALPPVVRERALAELLAADARRPLDPERVPLSRFLLVRLGPEEHHFAWTSHHLLLDGWSSSALLEEVFRLYRSRLTGEPARLPRRRPFRDYLAWLEERDPDAAREHWRRVLEGAEPTSLAEVHPPAGGRLPGEERTVREVRLGGAVWEGLRRLARESGLTPYTVVLGAWAAVLGRHTRRDDVVLGAVAAGRPPELEGSETMVGMMINVLPVRARLAPSAQPVEALRRLQEEQAEARRFEDTPLAEIHRWCALDPRRPLFDTLLVFQNYVVDSPWMEGADGLGGLRLGGARFEERTNYPVTLVAVAGDDLLLRLVFDRRRVGETAVDRLPGHLETLLQGLVARPGTPLGELPLLTTAEEQELAGLNRTARSWPEPWEPVHRHVAHQARRSPDAVAVESGEVQLSFRCLDRLADAVAARLAGLGVGPESVVAVCLERSPEMAVSLLGVLKAAAVYLPLDPEHPPERRQRLLADAAPTALVVAGPGADATEGMAGDVPRLVLDLPALAAAGGDAGRTVPAPVPESGAYLIYTSGSTGTPKGVLNTHGALVNRILWQHAAFGLDARDRVAQKTPFTFDVSVWELFWAPMVGARLCFAPPGVHRDPAALARWFAERQVTVSHFVPSMLRAFVAEPEAGRCRSLRRVVSSGEALDPDLVDRFTAAFREGRGGVPVLENLYGPTEAAIDVTWHRCGGRSSVPVPIGHPIANLEIHLLDPHHRPVPVGVAAELYIGGAGLARGYRGRPGLTAERFVPHPRSAVPGARLYRSGDLARRRPDGAVEYLGRLDHQLKVRGFRVEPGEIEAELVRHPAVDAAAVLPRGTGADLLLVAHVVPSGREAPEVEELRGFLRRRLPEAMVPAGWVFLPELPLNPSGKVDRRALAALGGEAMTAAGEAAGAGAPATPVEEIVAGIWSDVLGIEVPGRQADFFALGGHSLLAARVASRVRDALGVEMSLSLLLEEPRLDRFVEAVEARRRPGAVRQVIPARPRDGSLPLSFAQQRLWLESRLAPDSVAYNLTSAPRVHGPLRVAAWEQSATEVVRRHEVLRTRFPERQGQPRVEILPPAPLRLPVVDLSGLAAAGREGRVERLVDRLVREQAARPFDLGADLPFRSRLLRLRQDRHAAVLTLHHIVTDGWSRNLLAGELRSLYGAFRQGRPSTLEELPVQYADYAAWQRERAREGVLEEHLEHWRRTLAGPLPELRLSDREPRPEAAGAQWDQELGGGLVEPLRELARQRGATLYMVLLAAFAALLHRRTGQEDLLVGAAVAGRDHPDVERLIGFFVNMVVLRLDASGSPRFGDLLDRVRGVALEAYAHQELPFDRLVEQLRSETGERRAPFQVAFGFDATPAGGDVGGDAELAWEEGDVEQVEARFPLTLWLREREGRLSCSWSWRTDLFTADEIGEMGAALEAVLAAMAYDPDARVGGVELVTPEQRRRIEDEAEQKRRLKADRLKRIRRQAVS